MASVLIDLGTQSAQLVDLAEPALGHHHLCGRHAASTSVPMGWTLTDNRSSEITLWTELPDRPASSDLRVLRPTTAFARPPVEEPLGESPLESLPFGTTVEPDPVEVFARQADSEGSESLAAALGAGTPLLARAFSEIRAS